MEQIKEVMRSEGAPKAFSERGGSSEDVTPGASPSSDPAGGSRGWQCPECGHALDDHGATGCSDSDCFCEESGLAQQVECRDGLPEDAGSIPAPATSGMITARQAATQLAITLSTLRGWRAKRKGPSYCRQGKSRVVYRAEDVAAWIAENYRTVDLSPDAGVMEEIITRGHATLTFLASFGSERTKTLGAARDRLLKLSGIADSPPSPCGGSDDPIDEPEDPDDPDGFRMSDTDMGG